LDVPIVQTMEVDGVKLREARLDAGLSQEDLHRMTGVSRDTISKMETGDRPNPHPRTLRKLAEALGVSVADIRKKD
jgi:transcriptional regulator with XRE-family HTH domain